MKRFRSGFTLIEVSLFLAISGLLLLGIIGGTQSSISAQRAKDSVQNFVEFLKTTYSEVSNPQSPGDGRSDKAIYGRLISFGQHTSLTGEKIPDYEQRIYVYDVVGHSSGQIGTGAVANALVGVGANVVIVERGNNPADIKSVNFAGNVKEYIPTWGAAIDGTTNGEPYTGMILIVRHPKSGTISTLVSTTVVEFNQEVNNAINSGNYGGIDTMLTNVLKDTGENGFKTELVSFCVNTSGVGLKADIRRNVQIISNARNGSGVNLLNQDDDSNECQ